MRTKKRLDKPPILPRPHVYRTAAQSRATRPPTKSTREEDEPLFWLASVTTMITPVISDPTKVVFSGIKPLRHQYPRHHLGPLQARSRSPWRTRTRDHSRGPTGCPHTIRLRMESSAVQEVLSIDRRSKFICASFVEWPNAPNSQNPSRFKGGHGSMVVISDGQGAWAAWGHIRSAQGHPPPLHSQMPGGV